jgi:plasmid maintenance system antidote protein VapI
MTTPLNCWLHRHSIGQSEIATTLGVSVSTVSRICNGKQRLSMNRACQLHQHYGIPFEAMMQAENEKTKPLDTWHPSTRLDAVKYRCQSECKEKVNYVYEFVEKETYQPPYQAQHCAH